MKNGELNREFYCLMELLKGECRHFKEQSALGINPMEPSQRQLCRQIRELTHEMLRQYEQCVSGEIKAKGLIVLMDAYEICQDESVLQQALSWAEKLLVLLPPSPLKCKLLVYCFYYVEEPECVLEARCILDSWDKSCYDEEMAEVAEFYFSMVE